MLPSKYLGRLMKCSAFKFAWTEAPKVTRLNQSTGGNTDFSESTEDLTYTGELSKHRNLLPLRAKKHMLFLTLEFPKARKDKSRINQFTKCKMEYMFLLELKLELMMELPQVQTRGEPLFLINYINIFNSGGQFPSYLIIPKSQVI